MNFTANQIVAISLDSERNQRDKGKNGPADDNIKFVEILVDTKG